MPNAETTAARNDDDRSNCLTADREAMLRRIVNHCKEFQGPDLKRSLAQASLNIAIYAALIAFMLWAAMSGGWGWLILAAPFAAGMLVKLFIIQHDCGHGSFLKTKAGNDRLGLFLSLLTFTPYGFWRDSHNRHHASSGDLDRRGIGAVDTLTVDEYCALTPFNRFLYRFYRHPAVLILFGAPLYFLFLQRLPLAGPMPFATSYQGYSIAQIWRSVFGLNAGLVVFYGAFIYLFGFGATAAAFVPAVAGAAWIGTWLFFVQHQYEDAYWAKKPNWNMAEAAIFGSSHYDLPKPLRWITGNIGLHHIHHLASRIPNYRLMECFRSSEDLVALPRLTMKESLKCARLVLWDDAQRRMISFRDLRARA